jgi:hypothetical protein
LWRNQEGPFPQAIGAVFKGVLRKKHAGFLASEPETKRQPLLYIIKQIQ